MPDTTLTTLAVATGGAFLGKFVGPAAEAIGKAAWEQAQQLGARATAYLAAVGREPQPVEPKILLPLVQAASLETDEMLAEKWAALLANAADPAQRVEVQPGFAEVLRQLTPTDARLLEFVYTEHLTNEGDPLGNYPTVGNIINDFDWQTTEVALGNLSRLWLFGFTSGNLYAADGCINEEQSFIITAYGEHFMQAVTPPKP